MKCLFCAYEFEEKFSRRLCSGCFKFGGCSMIRCPKCGYEMLPEPKWIRRLASMFRREKK